LLKHKNNISYRGKEMVQSSGVSYIFIIAVLIILLLFVLLLFTR